MRTFLNPKTDSTESLRTIYVRQPTAAVEIIFICL